MCCCVRRNAPFLFTYRTHRTTARAAQRTRVVCATSARVWPRQPRPDSLGVFYTQHKHQQHQPPLENRFYNGLCRRQRRDTHTNTLCLFGASQRGASSASKRRCLRCAVWYSFSLCAFVSPSGRSRCANASVWRCVMQCDTPTTLIVLQKAFV